MACKQKRQSCNCFTEYKTDVFQVDRDLHAEADTLLGGGLRIILNSCGVMHPIGSYALRTMAWRDLDMCIVENQDITTDSWFKMGGRITEHLPIHRMRFQNERIAKSPGLPEALCWTVYLGDERNGAWKFDIWGVNQEQYQGFRDYWQGISALMDENKRRIILEIKTAIWRLPGYRRDFTSYDIYQAVLHDNVISLIGFNAYLLDRKGYDTGVNFAETRCSSRNS